MKAGAWLGVVASLLASPAASQVVTQGDVTIRIVGRMHVQYNTTSVSEAEIAEPGVVASIPGSTFEMRRARIGALISVGDWITGQVEPDFANRELSVRQAWIDVAFSEKLQVRMGQFKKAFSPIQLTSSLETPSIERGLRIRELTSAEDRADGGYGDPVLTRIAGTPVLGEEQDILGMFGYMGFDVGASVRGQQGAFGWEAGLFNGTGPDALDDTDGKAWAGRLTWKAPVEMPVRVGVSASGSERALDALTVVDGTAFAVDVEVGAFRRPGVHLLAELASGTNLVSRERFLAGQTMAAWWVPAHRQRLEGFELTGRASWGDPDRTVAGDEGVLLSPGFNLYFGGQTRFMVNWDAYVPGGARFRTQSALRVQTQLAW